MYIGLLCSCARALSLQAKPDTDKFGKATEAKPGDLIESCLLFDRDGRVLEWSKVHVFVRIILPPGYQVFEPWFLLELKSDWELPIRDFRFKVSSDCK